MNIFKSHFWYHKSQRNGILFLIIVIVLLQVILYVLKNTTDDLVETNSKEVIAFTTVIDSLKALEIKKSKPEIYPFNPNYITDYKGAKLGMSLAEIDRLLDFRAQGNFVHSAADFQKVTQISDSLCTKIAPYFKFPEWVVRAQKETALADQKKQAKPRLTPSTTAINLATEEDLQLVNGIGEKLSRRIINYRKRLQGFNFESQLYEVWKIDSVVIDRLLGLFSIQHKPNITKININTASFKEILKTPYIDYQLCKAIFEYKDQIAEYQNIEELKKIPNFPLEKYDRIVLYLCAE